MFVEEGIHDAFVARVVELTKLLKVGHPADHDVGVRMLYWHRCLLAELSCGRGVLSEVHASADRGLSWTGMLIQLARFDLLHD